MSDVLLISGRVQDLGSIKPRITQLRANGIPRLCSTLQTTYEVEGPR